MSNLLQYPRKRIVRHDCDHYESTSLHSNYIPSSQPPPYEEHHAMSDPSHSYSSRHSSPIPVPRSTNRPVVHDSGLSFAESSRRLYTPDSYDYDPPSRPNTYDMHEYSINYTSIIPPQAPPQISDASRYQPARRAPFPHDPQSDHQRTDPQSRPFRYSPPLRLSTNYTDGRTTCPFCQQKVWARGLQVHAGRCQKARAAANLRPAAPSGESHANPESSRLQAGRHERRQNRQPQRRRAADTAQPRRQPDVDVATGRHLQTPSPEYLRHLP